jgi:non-canonical purine NTP pyrophosphatase, rdgB/HAM1 family
MDIIFATNNNHKLHEVSEYIKNKYTILSLKEIGCLEDIPETAETLEGNALLKARYVYERFGKDCFADDTGLEVEALNNAPGVYSARYAGTDKDAGANMRKLLTELEGKTNRKARFRTVVALIKEGKEYLFEGEVRGTIVHEPKGVNGFGYDPIFVPENYDKTFAELDLTVKNQISHRANAVKKLVEFLQS